MLLREQLVTGRRMEREASDFVAAILLVLSALFYADHEIGSLDVGMCRYGETFYNNAFNVLVGTILAAVWGAFVSIG